MVTTRLRRVRDTKIHGVTDMEQATTDTDLEPDSLESDAAEKDSVAPPAENEPKDGKPEDAGSEDEKSAAKKSARRQVSISLRGLAAGALITVLVGAIGALVWLYLGAQHRLDAQGRQSENYAHAEKIALDYATNAAAMNAQDLNAWKVKLVAGTTPELKEKLTKAATSMEQILAPLQWNSTASPLIAKVRSNNGAVYVVDAFVGVQTKTIQAPDPLQSTAAYSLTIDSSKNWEITDVGGIGAVVEGK